MASGRFKVELTGHHTYATHPLIWWSPGPSRMPTRLHVRPATSIRVTASTLAANGRWIINSSVLIARTAAFSIFLKTALPGRLVGVLVACHWSTPQAAVAEALPYRAVFPCSRRHVWHVSATSG